MANALGRISGQLLKENLTRNGNDLSFHAALSSSDDPVLKLNVTNRYISINSDVTSRDLFVNEKIRTTNLISVDRLNDPSDASPLKLSISGNTIVSRDNFNFSAATQVNADVIDTDNIRINNNAITTKTLNTTLDLKPMGSLDVYNVLNITGNSVVISTNLDIDGNLAIGGIITIGNAFVEDIVDFNAPVELDLRPSSDNIYSLGGPTNKRWNTGYLDTSYIGSFKLENSTISTVVTNADVELRASGTGRIFVNQDNAEFGQGLTVTDTTALKSTIITGALTQYGNYYQTGNTLQIGNRTITGTVNLTTNIYFDNINIVNNRIFTTHSNDNLELRAVGTGIVVFNDNTQFSQAALFGTLIANGLTNSGTITSDIFTDGDIEINDNYITTTVGNNDLRLVPDGAGKISMPLDPVAIAQALTVQDTAILKNVIINGDITHIGNTTQTGNVVQTGNFNLSTNLTVTGTDAFFTDVRIVNNRIATSTGSNNLELRANGTAIIKIADSATFGQTLTVNGVTTTSTISATTRTITSDIFADGDIEINDNYITTTVGNNNLILTGSTTGGPKLEQIKFNSNVISTETTNQGFILTIPSGSLTINAATALKVPEGTTIARPTLTQGEFRFNSTDNLFRGYSTATVSFGGVYSADRLTSAVAHPTNNTLLFTTNNMNNMTVSATGVTVNSLSVDNNTTFATNIISTAVTNSDLYLTPNGTGKVILDNISLYGNNLTNTANAALIIQNTGAGYVKFSGTTAIALPAGPTVVDTTGIEIGDLRYNTDLTIPEIFNGIQYVGFVTNNTTSLSAAEVEEVTNLMALVLG